MFCPGEGSGEGARRGVAIARVCSVRERRCALVTSVVHPFEKLCVFRVTRGAHFGREDLQRAASIPVRVHDTGDTAVRLHRAGRPEGLAPFLEASRPVWPVMRMTVVDDPHLDPGLMAGEVILPDRADPAHVLHARVGRVVGRRDEDVPPVGSAQWLIDETLLHLRSTAEHDRGQQKARVK